MLSTNAFAEKELNYINSNVALKFFSNGKEDTKVIEYWEITCTKNACDINQIRFSGGFIFINNNEANNSASNFSVDLKNQTASFQTLHNGGFILDCYLSAKTKPKSSDGVADFKCAGIRKGLLTKSADTIELRAIDGQVNLKTKISDTILTGK